MTPLSRDFAPLASEATELLKALAHPVRMMICCHLRDTEMSVGDIETELDIRQPRLSRELAKLREEGLVEARRESKQVYYTLTSTPRVRQMVDAICAVMLGRGTQIEAARPSPQSPRRNRPGGYGVFARTYRLPTDPTHNQETEKS